MFTLQATPFGQSGGCTHLMKALIEKDEKTMLTILDTDPSTIHVQCDAGFDALHIACFFDEPYPFVKILLEHGADPNRVINNRVPLLIVFNMCVNVSGDLLKLFIDFGMDPSHLKNILPKLFNERKADESTVAFFLSQGEDINSLRNTHTALMYAVKLKASNELIKYLLINGADPTIKNGLGEDVVQETKMIVELIRLEKENKRLEDENALLRLHPLPGIDFIQLYKDEFPNTDIDTFLEAYIPILRKNLTTIL